MRKRRGDVPARALAGSLAAAHEESFDTVSSSIIQYMDGIVSFDVGWLHPPILPRCKTSMTYHCDYYFGETTQELESGSFGYRAEIMCTDASL